MGLEETIATDIAEQIRAAVDGEILAEMLVSQGWIKIKHPYKFPGTDNQQIEIAAWMATNCQHKYHILPQYWLFESAKDATMFTLRWA